MRIYSAFLIFFILSGLGVNDLSAQSAENGKIKFGVRAGLNMAAYGRSSEYKADMKDEGGSNKPILRFHIGGYVDYAVSEKFSLQGGLILNGKGAKESWPVLDNSGDNEYEASQKETPLYLELPVNAVYRTGQFYFGAGPYVGFGIGGKWKEGYFDDFFNEEGEEVTDTGKIIFGKDGYYRRVDFGINFLAGYQLNNHLSVGLGYGLGLRDVYQTESTNSSLGDKYWVAKNRVLSVTVGYTF